MSKRNSSAVARLKQDYIRLKKDPVTIPCSLARLSVTVTTSCALFLEPLFLFQVPYIVAEPLPSNLLEWHYVVRYRVNLRGTGGPL